MRRPTLTRRSKSSIPRRPRCATTPNGCLSLDMEGLLKLASNFTVARILERDDFHNRYTDEPSHQPARVPLSCHAGLRLRGHQGRRRIRRHRPALQPARRARAHGENGHGASGVPYAAAARGHRRRAEDVEELRELHRPHRCARRHVRQSHVHPRRAHGQVPPFGLDVVRQRRSTR